MAIDDKIKALTKQLYPTGRVWRINPNSIKEKFVNGLLASEIRAYNDGVSILDSTIPDNPNFTADDASAWEKRLGLPDGTGQSLSDRIKAIIVQLNWPGTNPAKGAADYIQAILQAAGYNTCVQENLFGGQAFAFTLTNSADDTKFWDTVAYGNGVFVASGASGYIMTSTDGITWTLRGFLAGTVTICFGNGIFVNVIANTTLIYTSTDGITWTTRTGVSNKPWTATAFGNGIFVVVANTSNIVQTSPDGITWTSHSIPLGNYFSIVFGNGLFVTLGQNNIYTSPDGITWTNRVNPSANNFSAMAYGNGLFLMMDNAGAGIVITSPDGITWTQHSCPTTPTFFIALAFGGGMFVAAGYGDTKIITSADGITWNTLVGPAANNWYSMAFGNNTFVATARSGSQRVMYSNAGYFHKTYSDFAGSGLVRHISTLRHGQQRHGPLQTNVGGGGIIIANSVDPNGDNAFDVGDYSDTIFVGGCPPGTFINIPKAQETAFRQMILKIKPVNVTVLLLVRFV